MRNARQPRCDRGEQLTVQLVSGRRIEGVGDAATIFDDRDRRADRIDRGVERRGADVRSPQLRAGRFDQHRIDRIADDQHLQIGFVGAQHLLQFGQVKLARGDDAILREGAERDDRFGLLERQIVELGLQIGAQGVDFGRNRQLAEPRILDPGALDIAVQRRRLAEQARTIVAAARQFARQHRLRVGNTGTDLQLAGDEEIADCGRIGRRAAGEQPVIRRHHIGHAGG